MKKFSNVRFFVLVFQASSGIPLFLLLGSVVFSLIAGISDAKLAILLGEVAAKDSNNPLIDNCREEKITLKFNKFLKYKNIPIKNNANNPLTKITWFKT